MPVKKRKLSPSSSRSATPAQTPTPTNGPAFNGLDGSSTLHAQPASPSSVSLNLDNGSAPPEGSGSSAPTRSSVGATPIPAPAHGYQDGVRAKHGVIQPGSGDGQDCGDECFLWNDLPMNKHGQSL
jgi:COMPASS component BRE2